MHAARQRGHAPHGVAVGDDGPDPVAATAVQERDRGGRGDRQVTLLTSDGAEVQARRDVDHQPGLQLAVGDHLAHVRMRGPSRDRPVHPAHIVTGLVQPRLAGFRTRPGQQAEVIAVQHAVELAAHGQFELTQRRRQRGITDLPA